MLGLFRPGPSITRRLGFPTTKIRFNTTKIRFNTTKIRFNAANRFVGLRLLSTQADPADDLKSKIMKQIRKKDTEMLRVGFFCAATITGGIIGAALGDACGRDAFESIISSLCGTLWGALIGVYPIMMAGIAFLVVVVGSSVFIVRQFKKYKTSRQ